MHAHAFQLHGNAVWNIYSPFSCAPTIYWKFSVGMDSDKILKVWKQIRASRMVLFAKLNAKL